MTNAARPTLAWVKSTACTGTANCVEIAVLPEGGHAMRDSKNPEAAQLSFGAAPWSDFLNAARAGEFDSSR
ncbi:MAG TPA: DUF397 domain-containing protein [Actinospica sp.]|nr:DUF397 domain-containing protein [Actinospica sp.]